MAVSGLRSRRLWRPSHDSNPLPTGRPSPPVLHHAPGPPRQPPQPPLPPSPPPPPLPPYRRRRPGRGDALAASKLPHGPSLCASSPRPHCRVWAGRVMTGRGREGRAGGCDETERGEEGRHAQASDVHLVTLRRARVNSSRHRRGWWGTSAAFLNQSPEEMSREQRRGGCGPSCDAASLTDGARGWGWGGRKGPPRTAEP